MDHGLKIAAAFMVLVGGFLTALMFRHDSPSAEVPAPDRDNRLVLRRRDDPADLMRSSADRRDRSFDMRQPAGVPPLSADHTATILEPMNPVQPPPTLARDYPGTVPPDTTRWGTSIGLTFPGATGADDSAQVHKIVDGDTLATLAKRYLGSEARALEIYEANRDVLPSPEVLPIGVEVKIPQGPHAPLPTVTPERPMVPIPQGTR